MVIHVSLASVPVYNIERFGAVGDGKTMNTAAIQAAIDSCSLNGGQVYIPKGVFMMASVELKDNASIYLDPQAVLLGSSEWSDYPLHGDTRKRAMIYDHRIRMTHNMTDRIDASQTGILRNVVFSNIIADGIGCWKEDSTAAYFKARHDARIGMSVVGQLGFPVENITFSNIYLQFAGGDTQADAGREPEDRLRAGYPEYTNLGVTPAYGVNCLNVKNIRFHNITLDCIGDDAQPAFCFKNVRNVHIDNIRARISENAASFLRFIDTEDVFITHCKPHPAAAPFASFEKGVRDVTLTGNDFRKVKKRPFGGCRGDRRGGRDLKI